MLLIGTKENEGWILSRWNLTYRVGWEHICKAVNSVYEFYTNSEILVEDKVVAINTKEDIFAVADYEKFNKSLCQYLDSIELAMYR